MAKDLFHESVKIALQKDGWQITHDPFYLEALGTDIQIDLGAEKLIGAQRGKEYIAVEVKSFIGPSLVYDFHLALGQYMNYARGLRKADPDRVLFLAVPEGAYVSFFAKADVKESVEEFRLNLLVYNDLQQVVVNWLKV
ncbi:element excision factor XisH family protein [Spirosoma soli]|uniref:Element excision factor XisH family protein n=1 Tax=Spirosoma soli TaxID=1770529 RepID=A0ABW5MCI4_9BACT